MCDDFTGGKEMVLVYRMTYNGSYFISDNMIDLAAQLEYGFEEMEPGERITITRVKMSRKKYESLPEFEGFG